MDQESTNTGINTSRQSERFLPYYLPCLLLLITCALIVAASIQDMGGFSIGSFALLGFFIYRRIVSGWVPNVFNAGKAHRKNIKDHEQRESKWKAQDDERRARGEFVAANVVENQKPGISDLLFLRLLNKVFSYYLLYLLCVPMEIFIQLRFLIRALVAHKQGDFLPSRRGLWPGEQSEL